MQWNQAIQGTTEASEHIVLETHGVALSPEALDYSGPQPGYLSSCTLPSKTPEEELDAPRGGKVVLHDCQKHSVFLYCIGPWKHHCTGHPSPPRWDQTGCAGCVTRIPGGLRYDKSNAWGEDVALTTWSSRAQQQFVSAWPVCGKAAVCFNCGNCIGGKRKQGVFQREQITHQLIWKFVLPK